MARKRKLLEPLPRFELVTARLYSCGHELVTPKPVPDTCPSCGAKRGKARDMRFRQAVIT